MKKVSLRQKAARFFWRNGDESPKKRGEGSQGLPARRAPVCTERSGGRLGGDRKGSAVPILDGPGGISPHSKRTGCAAGVVTRPSGAVRHAGGSGAEAVPRRGPSEQRARKRAVACVGRCDALHPIRARPAARPPSFLALTFRAQSPEFFKFLCSSVVELEEHSVG